MACVVLGEVWTHFRRPGDRGNVQNLNGHAGQLLVHWLGKSRIFSRRVTCGQRSVDRTLRAASYADKKYALGCMSSLCLNYFIA